MLPLHSNPDPLVKYVHTLCGPVTIDWLISKTIIIDFEASLFALRNEIYYFFIISYEANSCQISLKMLIIIKHYCSVTCHLTWPWTFLWMSLCHPHLVWVPLLHLPSLPLLPLCSEQVVVLYRTAALNTDALLHPVHPSQQLCTFIHRSGGWHALPSCWCSYSQCGGRPTVEMKVPVLYTPFYSLHPHPQESNSVLYAHSTNDATKEKFYIELFRKQIFWVGLLKPLNKLLIHIFCVPH